jgi:pimeloyl-ACP methyl ester carboxylesterase
MTTVLIIPIAVLMVACGTDDGDPSSSAQRPTTSTARHVDRAGTVDIGKGRELYMACRGAGTPTVVLVSGLGDGADVWSVPSDAEHRAQTVLPAVAPSTRVCAYDRPNTESRGSTAVRQPTSAKDAAADLDALLTSSGEAGPYVLVGHSYGGPIVRLYASAHPAKVAGLVLVDGLSEDLANGLTAAQQSVFEALNAPPPGSDAEALDMKATFEQLRASPPPWPMPVIVLTADRPQLTPDVIASGRLPAGVDQTFADALWAAQLAAQDKLAALFPDAVHITNTNSEHYIHVENPQLVVDSIRAVVDDVRGPGRPSSNR